MRARNTRPRRAINGALELDGARLVWQLASEQGWIPGKGMRGFRISVQLGKASLQVGGKASMLAMLPYDREPLQVGPAR